MVLLRLKKMIPKIFLHVMTMHTKLFCVLVVPLLKIIITNFPIKGIDQTVLCMVLNMVNLSLTFIVLRYSHLKHCKCLFTRYCTKLLFISINTVVKCLNYSNFECILKLHKNTSCVFSNFFILEIIITNFTIWPFFECL